jgi:hypothetical protein
MGIIAREYQNLGHNACKVTKKKQFSAPWGYLAAENLSRFCLF